MITLKVLLKVWGVFPDPAAKIAYHLSLRNPGYRPGETKGAYM